MVAAKLVSRADGRGPATGGWPMGDSASGGRAAAATPPRSRAASVEPRASATSRPPQPAVASARRTSSARARWGVADRRDGATDDTADLRKRATRQYAPGRAGAERPRPLAGLGRRRQPRHGAAVSNDGVTAARPRRERPDRR